MTTPEQIQQTAAAYAKRNGLNATSAAHYEIGLLTAALRLANDKLAQFEGTTAKPQAGCHFYPVEWGDAKIILEYEFFPGQIESWNDPAIPGSVAIIQALINGAWIDPDGLISQDVVHGWEQEIYEACGERHQDDHEDARIDDWLERSAEDAP
jgi:hypothetical protein